jgi:imidazolonepropionase-like amidohydrolase
MTFITSVNWIRTAATLLVLALLGACSSDEADTADGASVQSGGTSGITAFVGARIIPGDGSPAIEAGTFVVENGLITAAGVANEVQIPDGANRVNLAGATVMPMMSDTHTHLNTEREALANDLRSRAGMGINAAMSLGMDGSDPVFEVQKDAIPGAARYFTAGRGITRPEPGRTDVPHWVNTPEEAREAVREEAARGVDIIKIWVDDRNGQYDKMTPELYGAVIDEAHQLGLRTTAHLYNLSDAKGLMEAGIDAFAHGIRDRDVDDEFIALVQARPEVVLVPNMPYRGVPTDYSWLAGSDSAEQLTELQSQQESEQAAESWAIQARNLYRLNRSGMKIAMGTDGNTFYAPHVEIEDMVIAGMTPMQAIVAATSTSADFLGINAGSIAVGKSADFMVLDANPLDDITNTRRIRDVYLRGLRVDR